MIRSLRRTHRIAVCTLGVAVPVLFAAGIAGRRPLPMTASIPSELTTSPSRIGNVVWTRSDLFFGHEISTILRDDSAGIHTVEFSFRKFVGADVLVYWALGKPLEGTGLPEGAQLLGAFAEGVILSLPPNARAEEGRFILYSLAEHELVATSETLRFKPE